MMKEHPGSEGEALAPARRHRHEVAEVGGRQAGVAHHHAAAGDQDAGIEQPDQGLVQHPAREDRGRMVGPEEGRGHGMVVGRQAPAARIGRRLGADRPAVKADGLVGQHPAAAPPEHCGAQVWIHMQLGPSTDGAGARQLIVVQSPDHGSDRHVVELDRQHDADPGAADQDRAAPVPGRRGRQPRLQIQAEHRVRPDDRAHPPDFRLGQRPHRPEPVSNVPRHAITPPFARQSAC